MKKDVNVKSYIRRGRLVKQYKRKQNAAIKATIVAASTLGLTAASYIALKQRYLSNLNKAAKSLKVNSSLGKVLSDDIKSITFTIGGFGSGKGNESPLEQAKAINIAIKKATPSNVRKQVEFILLDHNFTFNAPKNEALYFPKTIQEISKPYFRGINNDAVKLAEEIYNWHIKNPTKQINIVGYSAGGNMSKDIQYILNKRGISNKVVTIGTSDFKILPSNKSFNVMGDKDWFVKLRAPNSTLIPNINSHRLDAYLLDPVNRKNVTKPIINYLFNDD